MDNHSIYSRFVNKLVWLMYKDEDHTSTIIGKVSDVDNDGIVIETFQNNVIIPIKNIIKLKERKGGENNGK